MLSTKKDAAGKFREALDDLTDALKANRIGPLRDQVEAHEFPKALTEFLRSIVRLPTDSEHVQGWTALYNQGRESYQLAQLQVFSRKSEA
jgi:hypothetical protein